MPSAGVPVPDPLDRGAGAVLGSLRGALLLLVLLRNGVARYVLENCCRGRHRTVTGTGTRAGLCRRVEDRGKVGL